MGMETIGAGLKTVLSNAITDLQFFAPNELPDSISPPCAVILPGPMDYDVAFDAGYDIILRLVIILSKQDQPSAIDKILPYIEPSGTGTVVAAVKGDRTLNGSCDDCKVLRNLGVGFTVWGGITYLSTEFEIAVWS